LLQPRVSDLTLKTFVQLGHQPVVSPQEQIFVKFEQHSRRCVAIVTLKAQLELGELRCEIGE